VLIFAVIVAKERRATRNAVNPKRVMKKGSMLQLPVSLLQARLCKLPRLVDHLDTVLQSIPPDQSLLLYATAKITTIHIERAIQGPTKKDG
jgi:hypothetical protein